MGNALPGHPIGTIFFGGARPPSYFSDAGAIVFPYTVLVNSPEIDGTRACGLKFQLDKLRLKKLVNEIALFDEDSFDGTIGRVAEDKAVTTDAEAIVAGKIRFESPDFAALFAQPGEYRESTRLIARRGSGTSRRAYSITCVDGRTNRLIRGCLRVYRTESVRLCAP